MRGLTPVTVVIPALDEERSLPSCIASVAGRVAEVIVVDGGSADQTAVVARELGASVIDGSRAPTIGAARNLGVAVARCAWILALDADEQAGPALLDEIETRCAAPGGTDRFLIRRRNFHRGREVRFGGWGADWQVRLFRRELRYDARRLHERLTGPPARERLRCTIGHEPYATESEMEHKLVRYARLGAEDLQERGRRPALPEEWLRPAWRLTRMLVLRAGVLDGRAGLELAWLAARSVHLRYRTARLQSRPRDTA